MPAFLDPNINAWWLDRSSPNDPAASAGFRTGIQVAQKRMDDIQQQERDKTSVALKLMDLSLERDRNAIAFQTFKAKQDADLLRSKGMAEIGNYLGEATKANKLTDPETQAGFWKLTAQYAPFINEQTVNSMWDNTFKAATDRQFRASNVSSYGPAGIQGDIYAQKLIDEAESIEELGFASEAEQLRRRAAGVKVATRINDPSADLEIQEIPDAQGRVHQILRLPNGGIKVLPFLDEDKVTPIKLARYKTEVSAINKMRRDMDPSLFSKGKDGKTVFDQAKYDKLLEDAYERATAPDKRGRAAEEPETPSSTTPPAAFRFDPTTRKIVPIP